MTLAIVIVVSWCYATTDFSSFDPHQLNAEAAFARAHPNSCGYDAPQILDDSSISPEQCQSQAMIHYMPGWIPKNPGKTWLGAACERMTPGLDIRSITAGP